MQKPAAIVCRFVVKNAVDLFAVMSALEGDAVAAVRTMRDVYTVLAAVVGATSSKYVALVQVPIVTDAAAVHTGVAMGAGLHDVPAYVALAHRHVAEEWARCTALLPRGTCIEVINACRTAWVHLNDMWMIHCDSGGVAAMVRRVLHGDTAGATDTLKCVYALVGGHAAMSPDVDTEAMKALVDVTQRAIEQCGERVVAHLQDQRDAGAAVKKSDPEYCRRLIGLCSAANALLQDAFASHMQCGRAVWKALETVVNSDSDHPEMLATYMDAALSGRLGKLGEKEVEDTCLAALSTVVYMAARDMFREHYVVLLARRLLNKRSVSTYAEQTVVARMKASLGPQFTRKMDDMFADLIAASDIADGFKPLTAAPVHVLPLKASAWPAFQTFPSVSLPSAMQACMAKFTAFYRERMPSRALVWACSQGSADVTVKFSDTACHTVTGGTLQAAMLLTIGGAPGPHSVRDLCDTLKLDMATVKTLLGSMLFAKDLAVLKKTPSGKSIDAADVVELNAGFRNPSRVSKSVAG